MNFKKTAVALLFVLALTIPVTLGLPLNIASLSTEAKVAEARQGRSTDTLRGIRSNRSSIDDRFRRNNATHTLTIPSNRSNATLTALRDCNRSEVRVRVNSGSWSNWRRANAERRVNVPREGTTVVRFQVRSENRQNNRTYRVNVRRASTNTFADRLTANAGTFNRNFSRNQTSYRLDLPQNRENVRVTLRAAHRHAEVRTRIINTNRANFDSGWNSWCSTSRVWCSDHRSQTVPLSLSPGEVRTVRFQIRAAFNTLTSGTNHTRTYSVTVRRAPFSYQAIFNDFSNRIRTQGRIEGTTQLNLEDIAFAGWVAKDNFMRVQSGTNAQTATRDMWANKLNAIIRDEFSHLPMW
ncbi:MAG: cadherin-like beta sandwich domain-containing protein [Coriobacteriia bacterium]|nr:cadherin-like beta sandwich domain-containing protein [Coriobacteriia bacterium]